MEESKQNKIILLRQMIDNAERNIVAAKQILAQIDGNLEKKSNNLEASQIIEGIFDGEKMIGLDGKNYPIPVNYASKSKLIEGDLLKLTITEDDSFVYKQISPADRRKILGIVVRDSNGKFYVSAEGRKYNVLLASLTYFKADEGDEVTIVVPREKVSKWAAIEAVVENREDGSENFKIEDSVIEDNNDFVKLNQLRSSEDIVNDDFEEEGIKQEETDKNESIEDEWMPDIEEMKKEAQFDNNENEDSAISDDLSS